MKPRYYKNDMSAVEVLAYVVAGLCPVGIAGFAIAAIWTGEWRWLIGTAISAFILCGMIR